jgi:hypothetical protein
MSLSGPSAVSTGGTFTISVKADPAPGIGVSGFATEVVFPSGLSWVQRPTCEDENQTTVGGGKAATCIRGQISQENAYARHVVISAVQEPPLPPLDRPFNALIEIDVRCTATGAYSLALTAVPDYPFGAIYFDTDTWELRVGTETAGIVDVLTITCYDGPVPTSTPCPDDGCPTQTPRPTRPATPTATSTWTPGPSPTCPHELPPDFDLCLVLDSDPSSRWTSTPSPTESDGDSTSQPKAATQTVEPDVLGATSVPKDDTPTPTLISETSSTVRPPATETDFSEVSPALVTPAGTAVADMQPPDAGDGGRRSNDGGTLAVAGLLAMAIFGLVATAMRRLAAADDF